MELLAVCIRHSPLTGTLEMASYAAADAASFFRSGALRSSSGSSSNSSSSEAGAEEGALGAEFALHCVSGARLLGALTASLLAVQQDSSHAQALALAQRASVPHNLTYAQLRWLSAGGSSSGAGSAALSLAQAPLPNAEPLVGGGGGGSSSGYSLAPAWVGHGGAPSPYHTRGGQWAGAPLAAVAGQWRRATLPAAAARRRLRQPPAAR